MTNDDVATLIAAFAMIGQDVAQRGLKGKAVISCSLTASEDSITEMGIARLRRVLGVLVSLDVPIILSAGNYGGEINTYPPMLADELPLITVGAVDDKGEIASWSQGGPLLTTAAGGVGIVCATNEGVDAYRIKQGTSFGKSGPEKSYLPCSMLTFLPIAAPLVAGMVAYWLGHPDYAGAFPASQVALAAKDSVTSLHWARVEGGYNVAYNGAHECIEDDGSSSDGEGSGSGSTTPAARRNMILKARQAAGNTTLGLGSILAASCPLPPSSSSSSSVITATPTTFATVTSTASATSTAAAETSAPAIEPMYCYSFDPACYVSFTLFAPSHLTNLLTFVVFPRVTAAPTSLVELAAPNIRANRAAGAVLAARPMLSLMVRSARCLLEYITHPSIQCSNTGLLLFGRDLLRL